MTVPTVSIVMTTWFPDYHRQAIANNTVHSWNVYLRYAGPLHLIVCDDGTDHAFSFNSRWSGNVFYNPGYRGGVGASLNRGFEQAFYTSPYVLYLVDDWALRSPVDITPWVKLLEENEDVGMVRLSPPHPNISGTVEIFTTDYQGWGLRLNRSDYAFGHRPALFHKRMWDTYGRFKEGVSAIACEKDYSDRFISTAGPDIVYALPSLFYHADEESLSEIKP